MSLPHLGLVSFVADDDINELIEGLFAADYVIRALDGTAARDKDSLLAAFSEQVLKVGPAPNWSAFEELIYETLAHHEDVDRVALIWSGADAMLDGGLPDLVMAADILAGTSRRLRDHGVRTFITVLMGEGPNFPSLPGS